jgi:hypothetical protein
MLLPGGVLQARQGPRLPHSDEIFPDHPDHLEVTLSPPAGFSLLQHQETQLRSASIDQRCQMLFVDTQHHSLYVN